MVTQELKQPYGSRFSSFHNVTAYVSPAELIELCEKFGIEYYDNNTGEDKVNFDFEFYLEKDDIYFTVYDWKHYTPLSLNRKYDFHIGSKDHYSSLVAKDTLINTLQQLKE